MGLLLVIVQMCVELLCKAELILTTLLLGKTVERVVTLTELADEAGQGEVGGLAGDHATVGIDVSDGDLDGSVVLGLDDAASGGALSGHVKVNKVTLLDSGIASYQCW